MAVILSGTPESLVKSSAENPLILPPLTICATINGRVSPAGLVKLPVSWARRSGLCHSVAHTMALVHSAMKSARCCRLRSTSQAAVARPMAKASRLQGLSTGIAVAATAAAGATVMLWALAAIGNEWAAMAATTAGAMEICFMVNARE